jgi:hypothetical protein
MIVIDFGVKVEEAGRELFVGQGFAMEDTAARVLGEGGAAT